MEFETSTMPGEAAPMQQIFVGISTEVRQSIETDDRGKSEPDNETFHGYLHASEYLDQKLLLPFQQKFPKITPRYHGETQRVFRQADELDRGGKHTGNAETLVDIEMGIGIQSVAANRDTTEERNTI